MCPLSDESPAYVLSLKNGTIPVYRKGNGKELLIVFHGFENDGTAFSKWEDTLGDHFTICTPDLPFHGQANWKKRAFNQADIIELIRAIQQKEQAKTITLAGFSLGGRLIICLGKAFKKQVDAFIFIAPAGIGSYEHVAPVFIQRLLEGLFIWSGWFEFGVKLFYKFNWISSFHKRYAEVQIFPKDRRFRLFRVLNSVINFKTTTPELIHFWQSSTIPTLLILGHRDRMVPNDKIKQYFAQHPNCTLLEIDDKHEMDMNRVGGVIYAKIVQHPLDK